MTVKIRLILTALMICSSTASLAAESSSEVVNENKVNPWEVWRTDDDLSVSYRTSEYNDLIEIKAKAKLTSSLAGFIYFLEDLPHTPNWLDNAESAKIVKQISINENIFIIRFEGLWPISAREMLVHSRYWQNKDLSLEIKVTDASESMAADSMIKTKSAIRMEVLSAHWKIIPTELNQIDITYQFTVDPKGNIPQWITKSMTLNGIWATLNNMREQLPQSSWQQHVNKNIQEVAKK
jgi:hypothetical protein